MPYITPEDMTPGDKLTLGDLAEFVANAIGTTTDQILYPFQDDNHMGPRAKTATVVATSAGMNTELDFDGPSYEVTLKLPGRKTPVAVSLGAEWMIRTPKTVTT